MISFGPSFGNIIKEYQLSSLLKDKDQVFLLLGGNIGNVKETFATAINHIGEFAKVVKTSALYSTEAWGMDDADDFINQALLITTDVTPAILLGKLKQIEVKLGRAQAKPKGYSYDSRTIDIDILLWGDSIIDTEKLTIPHPRMHLRNFAMVPIYEIAPNIKHPILGTSIEQLIKDLPDPLTVTKL